jgi:hypothetical protein
VIVARLACRLLLARRYLFLLHGTSDALLVLPISLAILLVAHSFMAGTLRQGNMEDYYESARMLINLSGAVGRLVLAGREMARLAGFTSRVNELMKVGSGALCDVSFLCPASSVGIGGWAFAYPPLCLWLQGTDRCTCTYQSLRPCLWFRRVPFTCRASGARVGFHGNVAACGLCCCLCRCWRT